MSFSPGWDQLVHADLPSIYPIPKGGPMPARLAMCRPDTLGGLVALEGAVEREGGRLVGSDLYRPYDVQLHAWQAYRAALGTPRPLPRRSAPGNSPHEGGIALDFDLVAALGKGESIMTLAQFWALMKPLGWYPIIAEPSLAVSECWHIEYRGPFARLRDTLGHQVMARASIAAIRGVLFTDEAQNNAAHVQYQVHRLGFSRETKLDGRLVSDELVALRQALDQHAPGSTVAVREHRGVADALATIDPGRYAFAGPGYHPPL